MIATALQPVRQILTHTFIIILSKRPFENIGGRNTVAPDGAEEINLQWLCNVTVLGQSHYFLMGFGADLEATVGLGAEEGFTEDCGLDEVTGLWD